MHSPDPTFERSLEAALGEPMTTAQRLQLDQRLSSAFATTARRSFRSVRPSRAVALLVGLLFIVPLVAAAGAAILSTEAPYGMGDAEAYQAELDTAKAVTPLPPGAAWPAFLDSAPDDDATYGTGLGRQMVEFGAYCLWLGYWHEAHAVGDRQSVERALDTLDDVRTWKSMTDPQTMDEIGRDLIQDTIDAAFAGDPGPVLQQLELNCDGTWPPPE